MSHAFHADLCILPASRVSSIHYIILTNHHISFVSPSCSPDDSLLCCGTSPVRSDPTSKSMLLFFEVKKKKDEGEKAEGPVLQIAVEGGGVSAIMVKWLAETNQILCR
jgi:hypothetical protein